MKNFLFRIWNLNAYNLSGLRGDGSSSLFIFFCLFFAFFVSACSCGTGGGPTEPGKNAIPTITNQTLSVDENVDLNTEVGRVNADDDKAVTSYTIISGDTGFVIDSTTGMITTAIELDYETTSSYSLIIEVKDADENTANATVTINVVDIDEVPPVITEQTFSINANVSINAYVGTVVATDNVGVVSYTITAGNSNEAFAIDNEGRLTTLTELDYDMTPSYRLTLQVADARSNTASNTITINVIDFEADDPVISNHSFVILEDANIGTEVGQVRATDSRDTIITSYLIEGRNTAFAINSTTGLLTTTTTLDYGTRSNYVLIVEVTDVAGKTASGVITINVIDVIEWQINYSTNSRTNDLTARDSLALSATTSIDSLKPNMFAWLDASISALLVLDDSQRLINWLDRKNYQIVGTNIDISTNLVIVTNTRIEIISNEKVGITNIFHFTNTVTLTLDVTNAISARPKSDVSANNSLFVSEGRDNYVNVDYQGDDRVGFALGTTPMGNSDNITAFYLVTEHIPGDNNQHVTLGYGNLGTDQRFLSKKSGSGEYQPSGDNGKGDVVLGDSIFTRNVDFAVPAELHLLSRRGLTISKAALNGFLGAFPNGSSEGGGQKVRELIVFTGPVSASEHARIVGYLYEKWNIRREVLTNFYSYYTSDQENMRNALDGNLNTYFRINAQAEDAWRNLFEYSLHGSVLRPASASSLVNGVSRGNPKLYLRTGHNETDNAIINAFRVEILRTSDYKWHTLTNIVATNVSRDREFIFSLVDASNDYLGYRLMMNAPNNDAIYTIDEFLPSAITEGSPKVVSIENSIQDKIHETNETIFSQGFTNYLHFDQDVYDLETSDFTVVNGTAVAVMPISSSSSSNYILVVRPYAFSGTGNLLRSPLLNISLREGAVTNSKGNANNSAAKMLRFIVKNPFSGLEVTNRSATRRGISPAFDANKNMLTGAQDGRFYFYSNSGSNTYTEVVNSNEHPFGGFDVGDSSKPTFVDLDGDGDLDMLSGSLAGYFYFYSNNGDGTYTEYHATNTDTNENEHPFYKASGDAGRSSFPAFSDLDGDGDLDMVTGLGSGVFFFYSNRGDGTYSLYLANREDEDNPLREFDVGDNSTPTFVDLDEDGDLDLVSGNFAGRFHFYEKTRGGSFREQFGANNPLSSFDVGGRSTPTFVDLDEDGDLDLVSGAQGRRFHFFLNVGGIFIQAE